MAIHEIENRFGVRITFYEFITWLSKRTSKNIKLYISKSISDLVGGAPLYNENKHNNITYTTVSGSSVKGKNEDIELTLTLSNDTEKNYIIEYELRK